MPGKKERGGRLNASREKDKRWLRNCSPGEPLARLRCGAGRQNSGPNRKRNKEVRGGSPPFLYSLTCRAGREALTFVEA